MRKIKTLTWFAAFCSLFQYMRERKFGVYLFANVIGALVPLLLTVLFLRDRIAWPAFVGITVAARLMFAPLDEYSCDEYSYYKLSSFPLQFLHMVYVRLVAKTVQISEWLGAAAMAYVYVVTFGGLWGALLTVLTLAAITLIEELTFYLMYLVRNIKPLAAVLVIACVGLGVGTFLLPAGMDAVTTAVTWGLLLAASIVATLLLHRNFHKFHVLPCRMATHSRVKMPLSSRLMVSAAGGSVLKRLVCMEWVCMLKLKFWNLVSALGYVIVFSALDSSESLLYIMIQYFIVDYCFLSGFNYFANINDREGLFLFSTADIKTQLRSKTLALGSVLLAISTALTLVLGMVYAVDFKTMVLTLAASLFCCSVMLLVCGIVSITHFHLEESRKKYTVSNLIIMLVLLIICSALTALLLAGGVLSAVSLVFMVIVGITCLYFCLVDMSLLEALFHRHRAGMIGALQS